MSRILTKEIRKNLFIHRPPIINNSPGFKPADIYSPNGLHQVRYHCYYLKLAPPSFVYFRLLLLSATGLSNTRNSTT
jgi:hypothetical protein